MNTTLVARGGTPGRTTISYDQALSNLGRDGKVRCGDGWMVRCPAHEDSVPSLKIAQSGSGTLLMHCKAGCSFIDVIDALKERIVDRPAVPIISPASRPTRDPGRNAESACPFGDPWTWWEEKTGIPRPWWEDNGVTVRGGHIAFHFADHLGHEVWKIRTPQGPGKYRWEPAGSQDPKPSLWPAPNGDLGDVIITEGETDCATLRYLGFTNTYASTKGAGFDISQCIRSPQGLGLRSVTILYDLDEVGVREAQNHAGTLRRLGVPAKRAILPLPLDAILGGVKDINDLWRWIGHDRQMMLGTTRAILSLPVRRAG